MSRTPHTRMDRGFPGTAFAWQNCGNSYPKLKNPAADRRMLEILRRHYRTVHLWIQTDTDYDYARSLDANLRFINPSVAALDAALAGNLNLDYVGNRLHAGIRALQKGHRAIIVEIDNRAREMGRDFGVPTVERIDFDRLERMIREPLEISVRPPLNDRRLLQCVTGRVPTG